MRKSIPSRVCDRCGEAYKLYDRGPRKAHALRVMLQTEPDGSIEKSGYPDLCPKCASRVKQVLAIFVLDQKFDEISVDTMKEAVAMLLEDEE